MVFLENKKQSAHPEKIELEEFCRRFQSTNPKEWLFRGQNKDHETILANVYRDIWKHRDALPNGEIIAKSIDSFSSLKLHEMALAEELIRWKVRVDRYFRFGFALTEFLDVFFPEMLSSFQEPDWKGTNGHLMAVHQHLGFKTIDLDWTWNPRIAAWFACHRFTSRGVELLSPSEQPVVYCLRAADLADRITDLSLLSPQFLRPFKQEGAIIGSRFMENFLPYVSKKLFLILPDIPTIFLDHGITYEYLFPDREDSLHDFYLYVAEWGHDFPWVLNHFIQIKDSAFFHLYHEKRREAILRLCWMYDAFWVRNRTGIQLLPQWRQFDKIKLDGLERVRGDKRGLDELWNLLKKTAWKIIDDDPFFSPKDWGEPKKDLFAEEVDEVTWYIRKGIHEFKNGMISIDWKTWKLS